MKDTPEQAKSFTETPPITRQTLNQQIQSIGKACLPFLDLMGGEIKHVSFDCPLNLRKAFKRACKASGTTVCYVLQTFMATYVVANHYQQACFSNTQNKVVIQNLEIPSYEKMRSRRKDKFDVAESGAEVTTCYIDDCNLPGVLQGTYTPSGVSYWGCQAHSDQWFEDKLWKVLE